MKEMSSDKSMQSESNSSSEGAREVKRIEIREVRTPDDPEADRLGMLPESLYSGWNILFGVFLLFTTVFLEPGDTAAVITQCFAVLYIFAGLLSFVIIFKSARSIFVVLTVFAGATTIVTTLTMIGFVYTVEGTMPMPELMMKNPILEYILGALLFIHLVLNVFSFFVFLRRSCRSSVSLHNEYAKRSQRGAAPQSERQEMGSTEMIVMDY